MNQQAQGLYHKFNVTRTDGRDAPGEKHHGAEYFVLDLSDDPLAWPAIAAYAEACAADYPQLAQDLKAKISTHTHAQSEIVTVPETALPDGRIVPAFRVGKYLASRAPGGLPQSSADGAPWVDISYHDSIKVCAEAGLALLTETQALAIAWNVSQQHANWSGGAVGEGTLRQGLHQGSVDRAQPGSFTPADADEQRAFVLSNGETIHDVAGNAYSWIFDDVQGDERGLTTIIKANSPSLATAPFPSMQKGMGWRPDGECDWSGNALIRGGYWDSERIAGAFILNYGWPDYALDYVGFRCTYPGL